MQKYLSFPDSSSKLLMLLIQPSIINLAANNLSIKLFFKVKPYLATTMMKTTKTLRKIKRKRRKKKNKAAKNKKSKSNSKSKKQKKEAKEGKEGKKKKNK